MQNFYILLIMCFYDWSIYNPRSYTMLKQPGVKSHSILTCEVYHPDSALTILAVCFLFIVDNT